MSDRSERNYAFLSNGYTSCIELDGSIEWLPFPRFDSPAIFSKILDSEKGGYFSIKPLEKDYDVTSKYIENSLVLRNEFNMRGGKMFLTDFMPLGLTGLVRIYESSVPFLVEIKPIFEYGLITPSTEEVDGGIIFRNTKTREGFEASIKGSYKVIDDGIYEFQPGKGYIFSLYSKDIKYGLFGGSGYVYGDPYEALRFSLRYWGEQVPKNQDIEAMVQEQTLKDTYYRSISVVLGLMYTPSGGVIAAATSSFPEIIGKSRNWDYRYVWVRDASFAASSLVKSGNLSKSRRILSFLTSVIEPASKSFDHPLYAVDGTYPQTEEILNWLRGHRKSRPVRVGNEAANQIQKDIEGEFIDAFYTYISRSGDKNYLGENWWAVESIASWAMSSWKSKSVSLWEERSASEHFVHTKVMDWVALDRAYKLAIMACENDEAETWRAASEGIRSDIMSNGVSAKQGCFVNYYGSEDIDSALLLLPLYDFINVRDPIFSATLKKIEKELTVGNGMYIRYKSDFLGTAAHPFTLINTWMSRIYTKLGDKKNALATLECLLSNSMNLTLFSEHMDMDVREPRGNFPQLFPHAGFIEALVDYSERFKESK
ncbi:MAG: glycoside hydrolase family 15 protein [Candidatus Marsarchaeota archaeon]|nr:glycoside hydrolase family 15 protein [Candidatus Marsarchaeota archaeon]MCL5413146.1 glycoside hydrolase family 15 protein [Candidatus Marsarchaeota archaeon]